MYGTGMLFLSFSHPLFSLFSLFELKKADVIVRRRPRVTTSSGGLSVLLLYPVNTQILCTS